MQLNRLRAFALTVMHVCLFGCGGGSSENGSSQTTPEVGDTASNDSQPEGSYTITYTVSDSAGNTTSVDREIQIETFAVEHAFYGPSMLV